ncbi:restriction endonuclease subunit S [Lactococcus petauri]|uniref:restriction endonuclease subunit S n=1 Tax=Lactococcus petauri TaxID=1940789 RepID=UPI003854A403
MAKIDDSVKKKVPELRFKGFTDDWEERKFKDILKTHSFRSYLAGVSENGEYEVIQQGDKPIVGHSDGEPFTDYKDVTLFGDHTVSLYKPKSPFFVATDGVKILSADNFEGNYLYTTLERYKPEPQGYKRHFTILKNQDVWFTENMEEQQKIGSFFKQLDETIALHQHKLDLLKEQKKGYLQKMFPKNGAKVPELRFAGFADDWEQRKLNEVSDIYDGTHQTPKYQDDGVMFLSVENIKTLTSNKFISREAFEDEFKIRPQRGDVLMTRIGDIGTANVVETDEDLAYYVSLALFKSEELNPYFLQASIYAPFVQDQIWKRTLHIAFPKKINKNAIGQVPINVPTLAEQTKIGSFFKQLDDTIALHQRKLDLLKEQKKGFLQKMFV